MIVPALNFFATLVDSTWAALTCGNMREPLRLQHALLGAVLIHQWGYGRGALINLPVRDTFLEPDGFRRLVLTGESVSSIFGKFDIWS